MSDNSGLIGILKDLQRRRVFRSAAIYAAVAWLITQVADVALPALNAPPVAITLVVAVAIVGFPVFVILAWFFDINEDGIVRTQPGSAKGVTAIVTGLALLVAGTWLFTRLVAPPTYSDDGLADYEPIPNSIAVLAFADLSPGGDSEHLSDGVSETLIHQLSQSKNLHVIARTSAFSFKGIDTDIREIGRALDVEMVLEGSVQRAGGQLRISAQLIDARNGVHIWSRQFDRPEEDIFSVQDEIAQSVATEILTGESGMDVLAKSIPDLGAYELYLIGRQKLWSFELFEAVSYFEQAIAIDPEYALAYTGLADVHFPLAQFAPPEDIPALMERAGAAIDRAEEIDPDLAEVWASRAAHRYWTTQDIEFALEAVDKAIELNPNYFGSYLIYGIIAANEALTAQDAERLMEARSILEAGRSHDPRNGVLLTYLAAVENFAGNSEEAIRLMSDSYRFAESKPVALEAVLQLAWAEYQRGNLDRAIAYAQIYLQEPAAPFAQRVGAEAIARFFKELGEFDKAEAAAALAQQHGAGTRWIEGDIATLRGDADAVRRLVDAYLSEIPGYVDSTDEVEEFGTKGYSAVYFAGHGGDCDLAIEIGNRVVFGPQADPYLNMHLSRCHAEAGNVEAAEDYRQKVEADLERVLSSGLPDNNTHHTIFETLTFLGEYDEALRNLELSFDKGLRWYDSLDRSTFTESIQQHPEYRALYDRMKAETDAQRDRVLAAEASGDWYSLVDIEPREW